MLTRLVCCVAREHFCCWPREPSSSAFEFKFASRKSNPRDFAACPRAYNILVDTSISNQRPRPNPSGQCILLSSSRSSHTQPFSRSFRDFPGLCHSRPRLQDPIRTLVASHRVTKGPFRVCGAQHAALWDSGRFDLPSMGRHVAPAQIRRGNR